MTEPERYSPPRPPVRDRRRALLLAGAVAAVAVAAGAAFWAAPRLLPEPAAAPDPTGKMQILIDPGKPPPPPKPGSPLEVLPPDMAAAAPRPPEAPPAEEAPTVEDEPPAPAPREAALDCDGALSLAQEMVCDDPRLADLDRRLAAAQRRALAAGLSPQELRDEQADWRMIREDAARVSQRALAQAYEQRIRELDDMAAYPPGR